jgi:hypothetical protein
VLGPRTAALKLTALGASDWRRSLRRAPRRSLTRAASVLVAVASALLVLSCASSLRPLSDTLPVGVPSATVRSAWERIDGDYKTATENVRYALFVDPERPLLFRITQYRVTRRKGAAGQARADDGAETVIWNATPGRRVPLLCFTEERSGRARPRRGSESWRDVDPATDEFRANMVRAIEIYEQVHREGRAGPRVR